MTTARIDRIPPRPLPLAAQLLVHAATRAPLDPAWCSEQAEAARQFKWVLDGGLGPLLHRAALPHLGQLPPTWREALRSADLTARLAHADRVETALEVVERCAERHIPAVLLKGISVSDQLYPAEHLRPMTDVDVLVPQEAYAGLEQTLLQRGYERLEHLAVPGHHHGAPLRHTRLRTVVELHTGLFPPDSPLSEGSTFASQRMLRQSIASHYHGRPVRRLASEDQLAYVASSWFNDLTNCRPHPSFLASAFDAAYLLGAWGRTFDWDGLLDALDNDWARASLHLMVSYLPRYGVEPPPPAALTRLARQQRLVGPLQFRLIHRMLDRQQFGGRPWNHALPPPMPGRYSLAHQVRKRVLPRLPWGARAAR
jgi:hypothetical protein